MNEKFKNAKDNLGLAIETEPHVQLGELDDENAHIVEATLAPRSAMVGRSLRSINFRDRYGFTVLAIYRQGPDQASGSASFYKGNKL